MSLNGPSISSKKTSGIATTTTLALWRMRTTWPLLLITEVALIAAIMLICFIPLFSSVTTTAALRDLLKATPKAPLLQVLNQTDGISTQVFNDIQQKETASIQKNIGSYIKPASFWSLNMSNISMATPRQLTKYELMSITSSVLSQTASHLTILKGRLAHPTLDQGVMEIMLTPEVADIFHVDVGSAMTLQTIYLSTPPSGPNSYHRDIYFKAAIPARVVGLFHISSIQDPFWSGAGTDYLPEIEKSGPPAPTYRYHVLADHSALLSMMDQVAQQAQATTIFRPGSWSLSYTAILDPQRITASQLDTLMTSLAHLQADITNIMSCSSCFDGDGNIAFPFLDRFSLEGDTLSGGTDLLGRYKNTQAIASTPVTILTLQITALILFFITLITDLLIDRQADAISLLRSRGASASQIFSSFCTQSLLLSLLALLLAPPLSLLTTTLLLPHLLSPSEQDALNVITAQPGQALLGTGWYALGTILAAILTISLSLQRATSTSILDSRRHSSRPLHPPLWQRLYLDVFSGIIALLGYGLTLYLNSTTGLLDLRTQTLVSGPLTLLSPIFFLLGCLLLFLRLFPLLLQWASLLSVRSRGAISMLALAHMARSPRHSLRTTLLLSLACAFCIFTFLFTSSQNTHSLLLANYEAGADFSGYINNFANLPASAPLTTKRYQTIPGVTSVAVGLRISGTSSQTTPILPIEVRAVDADSFAHTALWPQEASSQSLDTLMAQLIAHRADVTRLNAVPVIIDEQASNKLHLHVGSTLSVDITAQGLYTLTCKVIAQVHHIPTINDSLSNGNGTDTPPPGGILLDYQSLAISYQQGENVLADKTSLTPNYVWLRTKDDPQSLTSVRTALRLDHNSETSLLSLYDRRALLDDLLGTPFYLNLLSILTIGAAIALLLALVGGLLTAWLNARMRLTNFAVLRALGTTPGQVANILTWEQVIIYATALVLGLAFGALLSATTIPSLLFNAPPGSGVLSALNNQELYQLQQIFPAQITVTPSLGLMLLTLVSLCAFALFIMVRVVSRPSLGQVLRLNQD